MEKTTRKTVTTPPKSPKTLRIASIALLCLIAAVGVFIAGCYVNHLVKLKQEDSLFISDGVTINVNGRKMSVYVGGADTEITLVFMSGGGTCSPILDFKSLYSLYEKDYRVAVVEKAGYGFSDDCDTARDLDAVLEETREALSKVGVKSNLALLPHSMSAIEALYWANKYPEEIKGIVGLDPALPQSYENMEINLAAMGLARFGINSGLARLFPSIADDSAAIKYGSLTEREKDTYRAIFYRRTATKAMLNEAKEIKQSAKLVAEADRTDVPMLFFVSNGEGTGYSKTEWQSFAQNYLNGKPNGQRVLLDCAHYVHDIEYETIYSKSLPFIASL